MAAASAWSSTRASSRVLGMPMHSGSGMVVGSTSARWVRVSVQAGQRTVEPGRARAALPLRLDLAREQLGGKISQLAAAGILRGARGWSWAVYKNTRAVGGGWVLGAQTNLQKIAPARLVRVRKRRRPLEGVRVFANRGWVVSNVLE